MAVILRLSKTSFWFKTQEPYYPKVSQDRMPHNSTKIEDLSTIMKVFTFRPTFTLITFIIF